MTHKLPLYWENLKVLHPLWWNFWGIGNLYLRAVRGGVMMIGLCERWSCQLHAGPQKFFPSILSHRRTHALHMCAIEIFTPINIIQDLSKIPQNFLQYSTPKVFLKIQQIFPKILSRFSHNFFKILISVISTLFRFYNFRVFTFKRSGN